MLCILDGWGERAERENNAIALGHTPNWDRLIDQWPHARLANTGLAVGLPDGQMGNSEVGHTNLGAGRVVMQDLPRIDAAVADGSLARNPALTGFIDKLKSSRGACHLMGLVSPGGVHSHQDHMAALVHIVAGEGVPVAVHAFLDGRDTPPRSAQGFVAKFLGDVADVTGVSIATIGGRYYAMDRDQRWDRVEKAYATLVNGKGGHASDSLAAIASSYDAGVADEFMLPTVIGGYEGMKDGDGLLMANFRADRARQILASLVDPAFDGFTRDRAIGFAARTGMVEYSADLKGFLETLFPPVELANIFGQVIADEGLRQLRIAETEKYAHVTFFLNGGREQVFPGEERILVPSPRVATYDLKPEMSAVELTGRLVAAIEEDRFDVVVVNYANGDMVGHTGILDAAIKAVETVDACLGRLERAVIEAGGALLVTADHGNCELMRDTATGQPHTAHSMNPVPAVLINTQADVLRDGSLADVAPTLLHIMGLAQPPEMTGRSLISRGRAETAAAE